VLAPVPHRHVVFTMPRLLRGIFRKRRELLLDLAQCCAEALGEYMRREIGVRGQRPAEEVDSPADQEEAPKKRRCSPSWARLISKVYQADPLVCRQCGGPLKAVAYVTDELSITRILNHLGLSPPPLEKPPPTREVLRVAEHGEGWGLPAEWE
jgi:hypothetical protein